MHAEKITTAIEEWCGLEYGRSILVTCHDESYQKYVESLGEFVGELLASMAGFCGLRVSLQPRAGNMNEIPFVESLSVDIDSGDEDLRVGARLAGELYRQLRHLATPVVVLTGGKGYAVRIYLSDGYRDISATQYRKLGENIKEFLPEIVTIEIPHIKGHIRVLYTRHEESGRQVLIYDPERDKHIKDPDETISYILKAKENSLEYIEELIKIEEEEEKITRQAVISPKSSYRYIEALMSVTNLNDCRKRFGYLIALYLKNVIGLSPEESLNRAKEWIIKNGGKPNLSKSVIVKNEYYPPSLETLKKRGRFGAIDYSDCLDILDRLVLFVPVQGIHLA